MVKQTMSLNSKKIIGIGSALIILCGCTIEIPEGDIKTFVEAINFESTFEAVDYGKSVIEINHYEENDELVGALKITTCFDKLDNKYYYFCETEVSGDFYSEDQYTFYHQINLVYVNNDDNIVGYSRTDGVDKELKHSMESLNDLIESFFFNRVDAGFHQGGMYYGDYVLANCGKYYSLFTLDENKEILNYNATTSSYDQDKNEVITRHNFNINKYGMLLDLSTETFYSELPGKVITKINCDYSGDFEKIDKLNTRR